MRLKECSSASKDCALAMYRSLVIASRQLNLDGFPHLLCLPLAEMLEERFMIQSNKRRRANRGIPIFEAQITHGPENEGDRF